jgi:hypothetical protein
MCKRCDPAYSQHVASDNNLTVGVLRDRLDQYLVGLNIIDIMFSDLGLVCLTRGFI